MVRAGVVDGMDRGKSQSDPTNLLVGCLKWCKGSMGGGGGPRGLLCALKKFEGVQASPKPASRAF
jgi:hypothetical protein